MTWHRALLFALAGGAVACGPEEPARPDCDAAMTQTWGMVDVFPSVALTVTDFGPYVASYCRCPDFNQGSYFGKNMEPGFYIHVPADATHVGLHRSLSSEHLSSEDVSLTVMHCETGDWGCLEVGTAVIDWKLWFDVLEPDHAVGCFELDDGTVTSFDLGGACPASACL